MAFSSKICFYVKEAYFGMTFWFPSVTEMFCLERGENQWGRQKWRMVRIYQCCSPGSVHLQWWWHPGWWWCTYHQYCSCLHLSGGSAQMPSSWDVFPNHPYLNEYSLHPTKKTLHPCFSFSSSILCRAACLSYLLSDSPLEGELHEGRDFVSCSLLCPSAQSNTWHIVVLNKYNRSNEHCRPGMLFSKFILCLRDLKSTFAYSYWSWLIRAAIIMKVFLKFNFIIFLILF